MGAAPWGEGGTLLCRRGGGGYDGEPPSLPCKGQRWEGTLLSLPREVNQRHIAADFHLFDDLI